MTGAPGSVPWLLTVTQTVRDVTITHGLAANSCVATTRAIIPVLLACGVPAAPVPVTAVVLNAAALAAVHANLPQSAWPDEAWSVGVEASGVVDHAQKRWDGHLIVDTGDRLVDGAADMFTRPHKGLFVSGPVVGRKPAEWAAGAPCVTHLHRDNTTVRWSLVEDDSWQVAPDWIGYTDRYISIARESLSRLRSRGVQGAPNNEDAAP